VLAYATGHLSGGQMNPAVTLGLALTGNLGIVQAAANMLAQVRGSAQPSGRSLQSSPANTNLGPTRKGP
jgi:glycerol uptake facilitator-like aquaporin